MAWDNYMLPQIAEVEKLRKPTQTSDILITGVASAQATMMGETKPFGPRWQFIHLISLARSLGPASMDLEITLLK